MLKTKTEWVRSKKQLTEFLNLTDEVDDDLLDYIIGVVPPITLTKNCIQMGEPYSSDGRGEFTYITIEKINWDNSSKWIYTGIKPKIL